MNNSDEKLVEEPIDPKKNPTGALEALVEKGATWEERLAFVTKEHGGVYAAKNNALEPLLKGLNVDDQNKVIAGLIRNEWERAKDSGDPNTFMRGTGLAKSAMMYFLTQEINKNPAHAENFKNNPTAFVRNLEFPLYLKEVLKEIVDEKIKANAPLYGFAHNIVFSIVSGPMLRYYNDRVPKDDKNLALMDSPEGQVYKNAAAASQQLVNCNGVLKFGQESNLEDRKASIEKIIAKDVTTDMVMSYTSALENLLSKVSDEYKKGSIAKEVTENLVQYSAKEIESLKNSSEPEKKNAGQVVKEFFSDLGDKLERFMSKLKSLASSAIDRLSRHAKEGKGPKSEQTSESKELPNWIQSKLYAGEQNQKMGKSENPTTEHPDTPTQSPRSSNQH